MQPATSALAMVQAGRTQQMADDVLYLLEGAHPAQAVATRASSLARLATHCRAGEFCRLLRSRGFLPAIMACLANPAQDEVGCGGQALGGQPWVGGH